MDTANPGAGVAVARIWRGRTRPERADDYEVYLDEHGMAELQKHSLGVQMLRRGMPEATEFVVMSFWESVAAMSRFAGSDPTRIRHLDRDADYLIELPEAVQVFDILSSNLPGAFRKDRV
ncbi:MAG: hypothetical protein ACRCVA_20675 [Phreatobacter sp.]